MEIKSLTTPIGRFNSVYVDSLLTKLIFLNKMDSIHPVDKILQRLIDKFFSINELQELPKFNLQGTSFQMKVWRGLMEIPRGHTISYGA